MFSRIFWFSIFNPFLSIFVFIFLISASIFSIFKTDIDALPDLSENQVIVVSKWDWQNPVNIEDSITYPISSSMKSLPAVKDVRSSSSIWTSMVTVIFEDGTDIYFARERVSERLSILQSSLPEWVKTSIWPDATGLGQVFMYSVDWKDMSLTELRTFHDYTVKPVFESVSWVSEVASIWWYKKTFEVVIDPIKLHKLQINLSQVKNALKSGNYNFSWWLLYSWWSEIVVSWIWYFSDTEEISNTFIKDIEWNKIKISDFADVKIWAEDRRWILADSEGEKVWWIIVIRYWENPLDIISEIKDKIKVLEDSYWNSIKIEPFYDRSNLILAAIDTLKGILLSEVFITVIIIFIFLASLSASIITAFSLFVGILLTFLFMYLFWIPSNIMSLWWIAIAIWTMIDAWIVVMDSIFSKFEKSPRLSWRQKAILIYDSVIEIAKPLIFSIMIIVLSFLPILILEWQEWKLFSPLALTNIFAMLWALIAAIFVIPSLSYLFLNIRKKWNNDKWFFEKIQKSYLVMLDFLFKYKKIFLIFIVLLFWFSIFLFSRIWSEFMPPLDEWDIMYMPMTVPDVSEKKALELLLETNKIISTIPEVENVVWKAWRAETATDPAPLAMIETFIQLKPKDEWRAWLTKQDIINEMNSKIKIDKLWSWFTQPIIWRIEMLSTWIKSEVWIKIFWDDPMQLESLALKAEKLLWEIPWWYWITALRTSWLKYLQIDLKEANIQSFWLNKSDVIDVVSLWVWWKVVSYSILWKQKVWINLKYADNYSDDIEKIKSLEVSWVRLSQLADIYFEEWPSIINSENWLKKATVQMNVRWVSIENFIWKAEKHLKDNLSLPNWYFIEWAWQYESQQRAEKSFMIILPIVFIVISLLLYIVFKDFYLVSLVLFAIPFSVIWWIIFLYLSWLNFSVAVWVWFISLFWNAVQTSVVMVSYLQSSFDKSRTVFESIKKWASLRLRPVLMTAVTSILWLLPMAYYSWVWAELQKPLAIVVIWWLISSVILTLFLVPLLYYILQTNFKR